MNVIELINTVANQVFKQKNTTLGGNNQHNVKKSIWKVNKCHFWTRIRLNEMNQTKISVNSSNEKKKKESNKNSQTFIYLFIKTA